MGKVAIVTGSSRGIGREIAFELADMGYELVLIARDEEELMKVAAEISAKISAKKPSSNLSAPLLLPLDITRVEQVQAAITQIIKFKGRIDVLVNNAGIFEPGTLDLDDNRMFAILNTNLFGTIYMCRAVVPHMKQQKFGYIINIASRSGKHARPLGGIYSASKYGVVGFSESLYQELREYNVKITTLCPGAVNTLMSAKSGLPVEDKIAPRDIATIIRDLLSLSRGAHIKEIVIDCRADVANSQRPLIQDNPSNLRACL